MLSSKSVWGLLQTKVKQILKVLQPSSNRQATSILGIIVIDNLVIWRNNISQDLNYFVGTRLLKHEARGFLTKLIC